MRVFLNHPELDDHDNFETDVGPFHDLGLRIEMFIALFLNMHFASSVGLAPAFAIMHFLLAGSLKLAVAQAAGMRINPDKYHITVDEAGYSSEEINAEAV